MKFKIDENLPADYTAILECAGFQADTVSDESLSGTDDATLIAHCRTEGRIFMTLDLDFANIQAYPPPSHAGRVPSQFSRQANAYQAARACNADTVKAIARTSTLDC